MKTILAFLILFASIGFLSLQGCTSSKHKKVETETYIINTEGKQEFKLENVNGKITLSRSEVDGQLKIIATKTIGVRKKDLNKPLEGITITIDSVGSVIQVDTKMKKMKSLFRSRGEAKVDYQIFLPEDILTKIYNVNGSITGSDFNNQIEIEVVNGSITLNDCTGELKLETVNGKIICNTTETKGINISTVNGAVEIQLPNTINANISAVIQNGSFSYDEMEFKEVVQQSKTLSARLGEPSQINISVETVNGKISFKENKNVKTSESDISIEKAEKELKEAEENLKQKQKLLDELKSSIKDTTSI